MTGLKICFCSACSWRQSIFFIESSKRNPFVHDCSELVAKRIATPETNKTHPEADRLSLLFLTGKTMRNISMVG